MKQMCRDFPGVIVLIMLMSLMGIGLISGCVQHSLDTSLGTVATNLTAADGDRHAAIQELQPAQAKSSGEVKQHVTNAITHLDDDHQGKSLASASKALTASQAEAKSLQGELTSLKTNRWVKAALFLQRLFWTVVIGGAVALVVIFALHIWGTASGGFIGVISTTLWGVFSGGLTLIKSLAEKIGNGFAARKATKLLAIKRHDDWHVNTEAALNELKKRLDAFPPVGSRCGC